VTPARRRDLTVAAFFVALAFALRAAQFGNPVIQVDEQFYLLVGDRMWGGALPYVDFWDRKPLGLFLIYAATRLFGGDGVIQYQVVAACSAAATAFLIALLARRIAPPRGGLFAGAVYLIWLMVNGGDGGQAPVFYNPLVAGAALAVVKAIERPAFDRRFLGWACAAMALTGLALQVKYSVLIEGIFFGLALIWTALRKGARSAAVLGAATAWVVLAIVPTALALGYYAAIGHAQAFVFANFQSIFLRAPYEADITQRLLKIATRLALPALAGVAGWLWSTDQPRDIRLFLGGWTATALVSLLVFGTYHDHYALAPLLPLAMLGGAAYAWLKPVLGLRLAPVALGVALAGLVWSWVIIGDLRWRRGDGSAARAMSARIAPGETLFVFSGDPALYRLSGARIPTVLNFPTLLSERRDSLSLGTDMHRELARVMAIRPRYVATRSGYPFPEADPAAWDFMAGVLARDYRLIADVEVGPRHRLLYEIKTAGED